MTLRELIIKARTESNMTQGELSAKTGIPQSRISEFESGKREMGSNNIDKLLFALKITIAPVVESNNMDRSNEIVDNYKINKL